MSKPTIAIPTVSPEEVDHLAELRRTVRRVHKSVPAQSPIRRASADLSDQLQRLHRRGIPLHTLAEIVGLSHQAVRVRVRTASEAASQNGTKPPRSVTKAPKLSAPSGDVVLVADAGVHRRLHIFDPPEDAGPAYLAMIPSIPLLKERSAVVDWLETQSEEQPAASTASATRLRTPPAVYLLRGIVDSVLVPLTTEESR